MHGAEHAQHRRKKPGYFPGNCCGRHRPHGEQSHRHAGACRSSTRPRSYGCGYSRCSTLAGDLGNRRPCTCRTSLLDPSQGYNPWDRAYYRTGAPSKIRTRVFSSATIIRLEGDIGYRGVEVQAGIEPAHRQFCRLRRSHFATAPCWQPHPVLIRGLRVQSATLYR